MNHTQFRAVQARRLPPLTAAMAALLFVLLAGCSSFRPLLSDVRFTPTTISPNADGDSDVALIRYTIGRTANISIYFEGAGGARHYFRSGQRRSPGNYSVYWSGVSTDPRVVEIAGGGQLVEAGVLPDGAYRWVVEAVDDRGQRAQVDGQVELQGGDTKLPDLLNFTVMPQEFRPNQDGLRDDWVSISYYLAKKVERSQVYLIRATERDEPYPVKYPIAERELVREPGDAGYHEYRYEGGVELNAEPPPNGDYIVKAEAEDKVGNRVVVSSTLTIHEGGKPRADVVQAEIEWQGEMKRVVALPLGGTLCFTATVENIGPVPIRTAGPWPGQRYLFSENYNTLAVKHNEKSWGQQSGVWRFGINYDTTGIDFPFRLAIGRPEDLEKRVIDGIDQYYLLPGKRGLVNGCIEFDAAPPIGTNLWWGGLIHETVQVANNDIDPISVQVGKP